MKLITYPPTPAGFDPFSASDRELALHGLPRRPDPTQEPGLRKIWDQVLAAKPAFQTAELKQQKSRMSGLRAAKPRFGLSGQWAGATIDISSLGLTEPANHVFAEWKVPALKTSPKPSGSQFVGFWVGLGGDELEGGSQVLQAGIGAGITGKTITYWAWTEWVPGAYSTITNFDVQPGDVVSVLVCAPQADHGFVSMLNHRTNFATSVGVSDPLGKTPYDGSSVEWIVEAPSTEMPNFGSVTFTHLNAGTKNSQFSLSAAMARNAINPNDRKTLATGKILLEKNEVKVTWDRLS
jgi:hypothetical protein